MDDQPTYDADGNRIYSKPSDFRDVAGSMASKAHVHPGPAPEDAEETFAKMKPQKVPKPQPSNPETAARVAAIADRAKAE